MASLQSSRFFLNVDVELTRPSGSSSVGASIPKGPSRLAGAVLFGLNTSLSLVTRRHGHRATSVRREVLKCVPTATGDVDVRVYKRSVRNPRARVCRPPLEHRPHMI